MKLTKREVEVIALAAEGYTSHVIGDSLLISKRTVDFHLANAYDKLGAHNKISAVNAARKQGYLPA